MHFFIKKILEKRQEIFFAKASEDLMIIVAYIWIQTLTCSILGEIWVGRYSCSIFCLACVFLESDHSIFSLLHFPLGKSTLGQAASCSPTTKVSERHLVANEISIQKKTYTKVYPFRLMLEARKRGRVLKLVPECLVVKETRHLFPLFSYLAHLLRSLATKVSRAENEA